MGLPDNRALWVRTKNELVSEVEYLGFPGELGEQLAKMLGSPKALERMISYLHYVKPNKAELIVDEALAIGSEIDAWRNRKEAEEANARYNEMLNYGIASYDD